MDYYISTNGNQEGPFALDQLKSMWNIGRVTRDTPVWYDGLTDWIPMSAIEDKFITPPQMPVAPTVIHSTDPKLAGALQQQILFESKKKSAGVACLLNALIPGVGYMYAGRVLLGICVLILWSLMILLGFATFGITWIVSGVIWLAGLIDAFLCVNKSNQLLAKQALAGGLN